MKIACIGKRNLSDGDGPVLEKIGSHLVTVGCTLASGNAEGADQAYARGGNAVDPTKIEIYLPWYSYNRTAILEGNEIFMPSKASLQTRLLAERCHPQWATFSPGVKDLMFRNAMIIVGSALTVALPSKVKPGGGGTGHGIRISEVLMTPRLDLSRYPSSEWFDRFEEKLKFLIDTAAKAR